MAINGLGNWTKKVRLIFNLAFVIVLIFCLLNGTRITSPLFLSRKSAKALHRWSSKASRDSISRSQISNYSSSIFTGFHILSRFLNENASEAGHHLPKSPLEDGRSLAASRSEVEQDNIVVPAMEDEDDAPCRVEKRHLNRDNECEYIKSHHDQCTSGGFIEYIEFFYCACQGWAIIRYTVLVVWLVALLYMLGNTATEYFCYSLKMMCSLLKLHPTVAGVTLLPLGNGAPDVFASIASFVGADAGQLGFNSILGGAVFVTCIVVGSISLFVSGSEVALDRGCFVRDVGFFLVTLASLCVILIVGKINLLGALAFLSIYFIYVFVVVVKELLRIQEAQKFNLHSRRIIFASEKDGSIHSPLLDPVSGTGSMNDPEELQPPLPQWMWESNATIYADQTMEMTGEVPRPMWDWGDESEEGKASHSWCRILLFLLELPLLLPRRLTIPIVEETRWSRGFAIASAMLAPVLLAFLWNSQEIQPFGIGESAYVIAGILGSILGILAFFTTKAEHPPRTFLLPWAAGGFIMSIVWFYIIANELVALLVAFGTILDISPSLLALTVLSWGNSMGDLTSNIALASNSRDGVQIAMSGCYAGPMFNTLAGLGMSLVLGAWMNQPYFMIPKDASLFYTLGFLAVALIWALVVLPRNRMRPTKLLGIGLLIVYASFLLVRLGKYFGFLPFAGMS